MGGVLSWTLIIFVAGGGWNAGAGVTATPMASKELCEVAGNSLNSLVDDSSKFVRYICVRNQ